MAVARCWNCGSPYDRGEARDQLTADLRALGIARLDTENILTAIRPNIPLDQLTGGRLERLLTLVDRAAMADGNGAW